MADKVCTLSGQSGAAYTPRQAAYDLKKLRAKNLVAQVARSRCYTVPLTALRAMTAALVLRDKVIRPVLANLGKPVETFQPGAPSDLDEHYLRMQADLRSLFQAIGIAA